MFGKVAFKQVFYINSSNDSAYECERYSKLLKQYPTDIIFMGIGENGHIAFNDPHIAKFDDTEAVKVVDLDIACRQQQVNDGCFATLDDVPTHAITLTIPTLMAGKHLFCMVPAKTKEMAVTKTVYGDVTADCPASILKKHNSAILFTDSESGKGLLA